MLTTVLLKIRRPLKYRLPVGGISAISPATPSVCGGTAGPTATYWAAVCLQCGRLCDGRFVGTARRLLARSGDNGLSGVVLLIRHVATAWQQAHLLRDNAKLPSTIVNIQYCIGCGISQSSRYTEVAFAPSRCLSSAANGFVILARIQSSDTEQAIIFLTPGSSCFLPPVDTSYFHLPPITSHFDSRACCR